MARAIDLSRDPNWTQCPICKAWRRTGEQHTPAECAFLQTDDEYIEE